MNDSNEQIKYSNEWFVSGRHFYDTGAYKWMVNNINDFKTVLEIGCGTGHSTLSLLESQHKVVSIEKNEYCIRKAKKIIRENGYSYSELLNEFEAVDVLFLKADISDSDILPFISELDIDIVICWNVGSHWSEDMYKDCHPKMLRYGLTHEQIIENHESSYGEFIIWTCMRVSSILKVPVHLIERQMYEIDENGNDYYASLKVEFGYDEMITNIKSATSKSGTGRLLISKEGVEDDNEISLFLNSVLFL